MPSIMPVQVLCSLLYSPTAEVSLKVNGSIVIIANLFINYTAIINYNRSLNLVKLIITY